MKDYQKAKHGVVRLEELYALSTNGFNTATDKAAIESEATKLFTELARISKKRILPEQVQREQAEATFWSGIKVFLELAIE